MNVRVQLEDWEWDMLDAEADASGLTRDELLHDLFVEGAELVLAGEVDLDVMDEVFQATDRQWKSH